MKYLDMNGLKREADSFNRWMKNTGYTLKCPNCGMLNKSNECEFCGTYFNVTSSNYGYISIPQ